MADVNPLLSASLLDPDLQLESAEELYEQAPCGYFSTLPDGTFARVNQTFLNWTGYAREELVGKRRFQDLVTLAGKIFHETHFAPLLRMQGSVNEVAFDLVRTDGRVLPVLINTVQKRDGLGQPRVHRTTVFNATDRRAYERELLSARKRAEAEAEAKARLLAVISHEIRSPLNTISMLATLLQQGHPAPHQEKHLQRLRAASQHLAELVNDLLDYSKLDSGKMPLLRQSFSLRRMLESIVQRLQPRADEKGLSLQVEVDVRIPDQLVGDPLKIGQVLTNLAGNALKFTDQGFVRVEAQLADRKPGGASLLFSVQDTGIGIPADRIATIFEEFTQASPETTAKFGGTGLGLTISRKLVRMFGSDITVQSTLGKGSTFSFPLELEEDPATPSERPTDATGPESGI